MSNQALMVCGVAGGTLPNKANAIEIANPQVMFGGPIVGPVVAYDAYARRGFLCSEGARVVAAWNQTTGRYELIDAEGGC